MNTEIDLIKRFVNLNSYSSSSGYLGYFERSGQFNEEHCHKTIEYFFHIFNPHIINTYLISSLYVDSNLCAIQNEYGLSDELIKIYLKPLIIDGAINTVNYSELGNDNDSDEYITNIDSFDKKFVILKNKKIEVIKKIFFSVMFIDGIRGHCFTVLKDKKLIVYPHEDIGFGFISFGEDKKNISEYIRDAFNSELFSVKLNLKA